MDIGKIDRQDAGNDRQPSPKEVLADPARFQEVVLRSPELRLIAQHGIPVEDMPDRIRGYVRSQT